MKEQINYIKTKEKQTLELVGVPTPLVPSWGKTIWINSSCRNNMSYSYEEKV